MDKYKSIKGFYPVSCSSKLGFDVFLTELKKALTHVELLKTFWPKNWFDVKTFLENMKSDFISYDDYKAVCLKSDVNDSSSQNTLLDFLNDLGIILHFRELDLFDTHVLEPKWITEAVYKIINAKELSESKGILKLDLLNNILSPQKPDDRYYPPNRYPYIINLMKKFELCYEIDTSSVLIPQLLNVQKPSIEFDYNNTLNYFIEYDFLPKSVMPRFIVNMRNDITGELRWRTGVVLEDQIFECRALIEADERDKRIYVNVSGDLKRDYFAIIRYALLSINLSFEKIRAIEKVPMPDNPLVSVSYDHLLRLERLGIKDYIPDGADKPYNVMELLGMIRIEIGSEEEILRILKKLADSSDTRETLLKKANDVVLLQPNFMGLGLDINKLLRKVTKKL
jgi:internalin A